jgi:hypothetical protein
LTGTGREVVKLAYLELFDQNARLADACAATYLYAISSPQAAQNLSSALAGTPQFVQQPDLPSYLRPASGGLCGGM